MGSTLWLTVAELDVDVGVLPPLNPRTQALQFWGFKLRKVLIPPSPRTAQGYILVARAHGWWAPPAALDGSFPPRRPPGRFTFRKCQCFPQHWNERRRSWRSWLHGPTISLKLIGMSIRALQPWSSPAWLAASAAAKSEAPSTIGIDPVFASTICFATSRKEQQRVELVRYRASLTHR